MVIEWNNVTWYSKIAAVVLFVTTFFLGFWLGTMKAEKVYVFVPHVTRIAAPSQKLSVPTGISTTTMIFRGHVVRNETFQKDLGNNLIFKLTPDDYGWSVDIIPKDAGREGYGFASIATPPFHGVNDLQIEGWHFRNENNTAANDGSVNAPQDEREFSFVLNKGDANTMGKLIEEFTSGKIADFSPNVPLGKGELILQNISLGNLKKGDMAWIDAMDFTVNLSFPRAQSTSLSDGLVYHNAKYGLTVTFPDAWKGFSVREDGKVVWFGIKDQERVFAVVVHTTEEWKQILAHPELGGMPGDLLPDVVTQNNKYMFTLSTAQDFGNTGVVDLINVLVAMKWNIFSTSTPE